MDITGYNQTSSTSSVLGPLDDSTRVFLWGDFGTGTVYVEVQMLDSSWQRFPELTFTETIARDIIVFSGANIRIVVDGTTDVNYNAFI